jgi:NAD(P) transhydrogenase subunit alpha
MSAIRIEPRTTTRPGAAAIAIIAAAAAVTGAGALFAAEAPAGAAAEAATGHHGPLDYWSMLFVFMLATFIGVGVIRRVSRLLHTPLMSLTNAISAIAVVGSLLIAGERESDLTTMLGTVAVAASMTNIVSGFLITDRMLKMFREKGQK